MTPDEEATMAALRRIAEGEGNDLRRPLPVDFFVAVPDEAAGLSVAARASSLGFGTEVRKDSEGEGWTCYCSLTVIATFETVRRIEAQLDAIGREFGGHIDGFGSYGNAPEN